MISDLHHPMIIVLPMPSVSIPSLHPLNASHLFLFFPFSVSKPKNTKLEQRCKDPKEIQKLRRWARLNHEKNDGKPRDWSHPYWSNAIRLRHKVFGEDLQIGGTWSEFTPSEVEALEKLSRTPFMDYKILGERTLPDVKQLFGE